MNKPKSKQLEEKEASNKLRQQAEEYLAGWKRCKADFENYKKRQQEWVKNFSIYSTEEILKEIIPVVDNFELALDHIPEVSENNSWKEGIFHIKKQLEDILTSHNVKKIEVKPGDSFDPNLHECVNLKESEENSEETNNFLVLDKIVRNGYLMGDKLIRPAQVTTKLTTNNQ